METEKFLELVENREMSFSPTALKQFSDYGPRGLHRYYTEEFEATPDMIFGDAVHKWVLENDKFDEKFAVYDENKRPEPDKTFGAKENKAWKAAFYEEHKEKRIISTDEFIKVKEIERQINVTGDFFMHSREAEKEIEVAALYGDLKLKGFIDMRIPDQITYDLKKVPTARFVDARWKLDREYSLQSAFYYWVGGSNTKFVFLCFDKNGNTFEAEVSNQKLEAGVDYLKSLLDKLDKAIDRKQWDMGVDFIEGGRYYIF